jgi:hypothetical protein
MKESYSWFVVVVIPQTSLHEAISFAIAKTGDNEKM